MGKAGGLTYRFREHGNENKRLKSNFARQAGRFNISAWSSCTAIKMANQPIRSPCLVVSAKFSEGEKAKEQRIKISSSCMEEVAI